MSWFDTMVIPKGAPNGVRGGRLHELRVRPGPGRPAHGLRAVRVAGEGRPGASSIKMGGDAAALADSPILFPTAEDAARLKVFADLPEEVDDAITDRFLKVTGG